MPSKTKAPRAPNQLSPEREELIIDAALDVFAERGLEGATIDMVAKRSRVNKVTIYRRYKDKYDLFEVVMRRSATMVGKRHESISLNPDTPIESLVDAMLLVRGSYDTPRQVEVARLMVAEAIRHREISHQARALVIAAMASKLTVFFECLIERGHMKACDVKSVTTTFIMVFSRGLRPIFDLVGTPAEEQAQFEADFWLFTRGFGIAASERDIPDIAKLERAKKKAAAKSSAA